ncbi:hypothetical protein [Brevundimonas sp. TWP2-3-4b1]|uniref:hypothetical protein n=1 Tax=Brevundimonas sp. TWP2-3-4b1 TaxID=2804580 RepID=UPI003CF6C89D
MKRGWFGPKRLGWGASPASWKGWAATGAFSLALLGTANVFREQDWVWAAMLGELVAYVLVVLLTYDKNARTSV